MQQSATRVFERATTHHRAGRIHDAERDYLEILESEGGNADALRLLGALYVQTNRLDRAVACLEQAHFVQPENAETLNNLAVALRYSGRLEDAIRRYEEALQIDPDYQQALDNLGSAYFERGRIEDAIVLHRQALRINGDSPQTHFNLANALRERKSFTDAIAHYEHALRLNPSYTEALINLGIVFAQLNRHDDAMPCFEQALQLDGKNFRALNNLGNLRRDKGDISEAVVLYRRALAVRPDYTEAYINLGTALRDLGRTEEALQAYEQALCLKPDSAEAINNIGLLLQNANRHEEALARYDEALTVRPDLNDAKWNKALALLALGDYEQGWMLHEVGLGSKRGAVVYRGQRWDGRELDGERLLIWSEQGLGDSLQFVRYAALCKQWGAHVTVQCQPQLARLFKNCTYIDDVVTAAKEGDFDFQVPMMSLPHTFRTMLETIPAAVPYLHVDEGMRQKWRPQFENVEGLKVGLVWSGSPRMQQIDAHLIDRRRSLGLPRMKPLLDVPNVNFYSLQKGSPATDIVTCDVQDRIVDLMNDAEDFLDTAAIIENLDLVIAADTAVAHVAGALGKPVWVLSRFDACWRWLRNRETNPWYPTARVFGQPAPGDWTQVIEKAKETLTRMSVG